jgi:uncharacterized membrane protein YcaP (DUF421 family)
MEVIKILFGEGRDLNALQMGCRAVVVFLITILLLRIAGMRAFGKKSTFDTTIVIILGAILSRAVVGVSPFFPTITAAFVLSIIHRLIAWISFNNQQVGVLIKGKKVSLYKDGVYNLPNMKRTCLSKEDLLEDVRLEMNTSSLEGIEEIFMESSGQISIIKKQNEIS